MKEDISILLTDRDFQKTLTNWISFNQIQKDEVLKSYNLSSSDIETLLQVWSSLRFSKQNLTTQLVEEALEETIWEVAERNSAANKSTPAKKLYIQFSKIAAILIIPLIVYTAVNFLQSEETFIMNDAVQMVTVSSQPGTISNIILPDGTKVYLNSGSSVSYPQQFQGTTRNVKLFGEAYFEVVKNKQMPMVLTADDIQLKVYGTSFNVNAYQDEDLRRVTLVEGSISMQSPVINKNDKNEFFVTPGQTVSIYENKNQFVVENNDPYPYIAWKDGLLVFRNTHFQTVLKKLSLRFNVDIQLKDPSLSLMPLDATFSDENVNEVLRLLSLSIPFKFYYGKDKRLADGTFEKCKIYIVKK